MTPEVFVWRRPVVIDWRGEKRDGEITVRCPERHPKIDWECRVFLSELLKHEVGVSGIDEIDAVANGLRYLRRLIAEHKKWGVQVSWLEEGDDACV